MTTLDVYSEQFGTGASRGECILCLEESDNYIFCEYCRCSDIDAALKGRVLTAITLAYEGEFDISVHDIVMSD